MKSQYIKILKKQISKLDEESFDLEAWKTGSISVLNRIFGESNSRVKQIKTLRIDYSSWALRDSSSNYKPVDTAKLRGKEILNTAIDEIEIFDVPDNHASDAIGKDLQAMNENERKKYFEGMKKEKLVELLMKITTI